MSCFEGFDADDVNGVDNKSLPNLKQLSSDDIFGNNRFKSLYILGNCPPDKWTVFMQSKSLKDLPEFLLFFVSQMGVGNGDKAGRDYTRRVGGLILGELDDKWQVVVFVE